MPKNSRSFAIGTRYRQLRNAQPFRPFVITLAAGEKYRVSRGDHAIINPGHTQIYFYDHKLKPHALDTDDIASVEPVSKRRRKRG